MKTINRESFACRFEDAWMKKLIERFGVERLELENDPRKEFTLEKKEVAAQPSKDKDGMKLACASVEWQRSDVGRSDFLTIGFSIRR